jgi:phosphoglycolate phosphatase
MKHHLAIIFDLDGTLVDSLRDITDALNEALTELNKPTVARQEVRSWVGEGMPLLCRRALPAHSDSLVEELVRRTKSRYLAHPVRCTRPYPNILTMLELLQIEGVPMAVLSNKPHDLTVRIVAELGLAPYFAQAVGCQLEEEKKPLPTSALRLARALGADPAAVFLVGDSATDIETARNAGMCSVAVTWGFRDRDELIAARPDHLIDDPLKILPLLNN